MQNLWQGYPELKKICGCESAGNPNSEPRQFESSTPLWSKKGTADVGACQISIPAHKTELQKLGLDVINSEADNVKYAKLLFDKNGTKDWLASKSCWNTK